MTHFKVEDGGNNSEDSLEGRECNGCNRLVPLHEPLVAPSVTSLNMYCPECLETYNDDSDSDNIIEIPGTAPMETPADQVVYTSWPLGLRFICSFNLDINSS